MAEASHIIACARILRAEDYDRYLTALHAKGADRSVLFALYAFNSEIAKVRDIVSEPMLGEIRLQWWREGIDALFEGRVREHDVPHQVVGALAEAVGHGTLEQADLTALIDAREADLYSEQPESLDALETYLGATFGATQQLAAKALGGGTAAQLAAQAIGLAWGLTGIMRALPHHVAQNRIYIPGDMMRAAGLTNPSRPEGEQMAALADILSQLTARARGHIAAARERAGDIEPRVRSVLRLAPLAEGYLGTLEKAGFDPESVVYERGAMGRQLRLTWAALRRGY